MGEECYSYVLDWPERLCSTDRQREIYGYGITQHLEFPGCCLLDYANEMYLSAFCTCSTIMKLIFAVQVINVVKLTALITLHTWHPFWSDCSITLAHCGKTQSLWIPETTKIDDLSTSYFPRITWAMKNSAQKWRNLHDRKMRVRTRQKLCTVSCYLRWVNTFKYTKW